MFHSPVDDLVSGPKAWQKLKKSIMTGIAIVLSGEVSFIPYHLLILLLNDKNNIDRNPSGGCKRLKQS